MCVDGRDENRSALKLCFERDRAKVSAKVLVIITLQGPTSAEQALTQALDLAT
jgi:hypothetical protein